MFLLVLASSMTNMVFDHARNVIFLEEASLMHNNNLIHYTVPDSDDILSEMTVHNLEGKELEMMPQPDISVASLYVSTFEVPECSTTKLG